MEQFVTSKFGDNARILTTIVFLKNMKFYSCVKRRHERAVFWIVCGIKIT
ncbi:hypothetical protein TERMP_01847 [Thermococcus barophilus MP]|uniref:Uncharacterized protein n=1 Tax=Thermococcus barophilus (strain DSM 11836 / MP) TaxID=391623 RepID=F0LKI8_THEBM|nr:hypothetical protein TERMP_01847 [Thermococcus barophilus MP]